MSCVQCELNLCLLLGAFVELSWDSQKSQIADSAIGRAPFKKGGSIFPRHASMPSHFLTQQLLWTKLFPSPFLFRIFPIFLFFFICFHFILLYVLSQRFFSTASLPHFLFSEPGVDSLRHTRVLHTLRICRIPFGIGQKSNSTTASLLPIHHDAITWYPG